MGTAKEDLYPHANGATGCPATLMASGRWPGYEATVDRYIVAGKGATPGPTPPPEPEYDEAEPVPREWDGTDWRRDDGALFVALRRVFVAAKANVPCLRWADPAAPAVRRPLPEGEAFEAFYVVRGGDGRPWLVSRWGSRVPADGCLPKLASFGRTPREATAGMVGMADTESDIDPIEADPYAGLSAADPPEGDEPIDKTTFMVVGAAS